MKVKQVLILFVCLIMVSTCIVYAGAQEVSPIRIGALLTLTTIEPLISQEEKRGVELAVEKIGGEIGGRPIEVYFADISSLENTKSEALRLIQNLGCKILIGSGIDDFDLAIATIAQRNNVIHWEFLNGSFELMSGGFDRTFRINPSAASDGRAQANFFLEKVIPALKMKPEDFRVGYINNDYPWGTWMAETCINILEKAGIKVVFHDKYNEETIRSMSTVVLKMIKSDVNVLFSAMFPPGGSLFWQAAKTMDFNPVAAIGTGGFEVTMDAYEVLGAAVDGLVGSNFPIENTDPAFAKGMKEFAENYKKKYNREHFETCHGASAYTGMLFLFDALERTENLDDVNSIIKSIKETDIPIGVIGNGWGCKFSTTDEPFNGQVNQNIRVVHEVDQWQDGEMWAIYPYNYPGREFRLLSTWKEKEKQ